MSAWIRDLISGASVTAALVLMAAGVSKLGSLRTFASQVVTYDVLPAAAARLLGFALPALEILIGVALVVVPRFGGWPAAVLYVMFATAIAINLLRGRTTLICGCFGPTGKHRISAAHVAANLLAGLSSALAAAGDLAPNLAGTITAVSLALTAVIVWTVRGTREPMPSRITARS